MLNDHLNFLNMYVSAHTEEEITVVSKHGLPGELKEISNGKAIKEGNFIYLPEDFELSDYKRMCLTKLVEMEESSSLDLDNFQEKDVASTLYQMLEEQRCSSLAAEKYPRVFVERNETSLSEAFTCRMKSTLCSLKRNFATAVSTPPVDPSNRIFGLPAQALTILSQGPQTLSVFVSGLILFIGNPSIRVPGHISKILSTVASSKSSIITGRSNPFIDLTTFILFGPAID